MKVHYCKRCTLPSAYPGSSLQRGICAFCRHDGRRQGIGVSETNRVRQEMLSFFDALRGSAAFDCVLCYSGGKDSTYVLDQVVRTYKLKPLVVTIDNGFLPAVTKNNIDKITSLLGVEHHLIKINRAFMRELILASIFDGFTSPNALRRISSICSSCIFLVNTTAIKYTLRWQIPLIIAGFTPGQAPAPVYGNRLVLMGGSRDRRVALLRRRLGKMADFYFEIDREDRAAEDPYPIHINPLFAEPYNEGRVLRRMAELGWEKPKDTGKCSTNCRLNCLGNYVHFRKFGFSPYAKETAELVRAGALSYARGREIVEDVAFDDNVRECLRWLEISEDGFFARLGAEEL